MKRRICVIGHFAKGENLLNGQTVKTKIVTKELTKNFGKEQIGIIDTHGGRKAVIKAPFQCISALKSSSNIIICPAENGLRVFAPLLVSINRIFKRKLHYVVIGGWLPAFLENKVLLSFFLKRFDCIYVETKAMKKALVKKGFSNIEVVSNCKELDILSEDEIMINNNKPYRFCTFSRVMKEKGIEDAVNAVKYINDTAGKILVTLDIYGQIESSQKEWFKYLEETFPSFISYGGIVPYEKSTDVLKDYFGLLFPTYYEGEGFAGTLIDAMAAGVPVIASDWKYNSEIVKNGANGRIIETNLVEEIIRVIDNPDSWIEMKKNCLKEAITYLPQHALYPLIQRIQ